MSQFTRSDFIVACPARSDGGLVMGLRLLHHVQIVNIHRRGAQSDHTRHYPA